jgi:hypothetical protein
VEDGECYSCGLFLDDVLVCPGCGAVQTLSPGRVQQPRCAEHLDRVATFTCKRCGRFGCAQCEVEDSGGCWACLPSQAEGLTRELQATRRRMIACVFAFSVLAPMVALSAHQVPLAVALTVFSGTILSLSINAFVHRDFSVLALSLMGIACILLVFLLSETLLALVPLGTAVSLFVQMNRSSQLEIERWRTARLQAR